MGICLSSTKVSGSSSNNAGASNRNRKCSAPVRGETVTAQKQQPSQGQRRRVPDDSQKHPRPREKTSTRRQGGHVPCGKRTDFGYDKNFDKKFSLGKLLGHGQFGYTYVGIDKVNGDRVAVKRLEKNKVFSVTLSVLPQGRDTQFRFCDRYAEMEICLCSFSNFG
ncbi:unnamed protein product [Sphenostylis stenocarpa]|uniref:Protein kinase domain-containing protein n=1 Tax=Sphenostylis stenocarpa TaxID=92480 RepID=A0AA86VWL0_9FABA|nr:unnamed protein product [Sphenostylis stenocarpa]